MAIQVIIEALASSTEETKTELDQSLVTFGRSKSCHVELEHALVSRRHFIIKFVDESYVLIDEGSSHGTILDGQKLVPHTNYSLSSMHVIEVPGFSIKFLYDGQKPKLERTTVVARKLLDELLQGDVALRDCPILEDSLRTYCFNFTEEKASFTLGTSPQGDFVVDDPLVSKRHASFVRDLHGIRLIPLAGHHVYIDNVLINEPQILTHGSLIKVGSIELIFKDLEGSATDDEDDDFEISAQEIKTALEAPLEPPAEVVKAPIITASKGIFKTLDRVFLVAFVLVVAGASAMFFELI